MTNGEKHTETPRVRPTCLGIGLMAVMVLGLAAWMALIVIGHFHHVPNR